MGLTSKDIKARKAASGFNDEPSVLRRRARDLERAGYAPSWCAVFLRAADELEARRRAATGEEQMVVDAIAVNRRLRNTLAAVFNQVRAQQPAGWAAMVLETVKGALSATKEFGHGRRILAIQVGDGMTRAEVEARVALALDAYFPVAPAAPAAPATGGADADADARPS